MRGALIVILLMLGGAVMASANDAKRNAVTSVQTRNGNIALWVGFLMIVVSVVLFFRISKS